MGRFFSRMFRCHVPKTKPRLQQCSRSPSSSSSSFQRLRLFHVKRAWSLPPSSDLSTALIGTEIHDVMLHCVSIFVKKNVSQNLMEKCITSLSQCSTNPRVRLPVPTSVRGRSSVFGKRKSSREPCRPEDQGSGCETRTPGGHKVMRSS